MINVFIFLNYYLKNIVYPIQPSQVVFINML